MTGCTFHDGNGANCIPAVDRRRNQPLVSAGRYLASRDQLLMMAAFYILQPHRQPPRLFRVARGYCINDGKVFIAPGCSRSGMRRVLGHAFAAASHGSGLGELVAAGHCDGTMDQIVDIPMLGGCRTVGLHQSPDRGTDEFGRLHIELAGGKFRSFAFEELPNIQDFDIALDADFADRQQAAGLPRATKPSDSSLLSASRSGVRDILAIRQDCAPAKACPQPAFRDKSMSRSWRRPLREVADGGARRGEAPSGCATAIIGHVRRTVSAKNPKPIQYTK